MNPSILPDDFRFSQGSLQDHVDCPRRFQLRYLARISWPALEAEPPGNFDAHIRQGQAFHRLVHQHILGLPEERLSRCASEEDDPAAEQGQLSAWWANYLNTPPGHLPRDRYAEVALSAPIHGHRLIAKYDLIAVEPGQRAVIVDWKTSKKRSTAAWLSARLQTRVYRCLLIQAGDDLNDGTHIRPENVTMTYWYANHPETPIELSYDPVQFEADLRYLSDLVAEIKGLSEDDFPLTDDIHRCRFCPYRSLCGRGVEAGALETIDDADKPDLESSGGLDIDFEQISEIAF